MSYLKDLKGFRQRLKEAEIDGVSEWATWACEGKLDFSEKLYNKYRKAEGSIIKPHHLGAAYHYAFSGMEFLNAFYRYQYMKKRSVENGIK